MRMTDKDKVVIVAAASMVSLVVILKNILLVPADTLSRDIMLYIIVYFGFVVSYPAGRMEKKSKCCSPVYWSIAIILITLAIIAVYAI
ncbi:MAG: hypothetical protein MUP55_00455 [Candidatus Aenigmarchaeota archaeon]|nr:hypothetical protein [Candidatus Aenigmarchaeota archaeon]